MSELIERLEKLSGPSRELDALIYAQISGGGEWHNNVLRIPSLKLNLGSIDPGKHSRNFTIWFAETPAYTASLDAAMTLVPEGFWWEVAHGLKGHDGRGPYWSECYDENTWHESQHPQIGAPTPAIALCIAALKARAA